MNNQFSPARSRRATIADRLVQVRRELYGEHGGPELARILGLPARTWLNYERGVTIPGEVLLAFLEATGVEPLWLLHGRLPRYRPGSPSGRAEGREET